MSKARKKPLWEMNKDELKKATREFDREDVKGFKPLTPAKQAVWSG